MRETLVSFDPTAEQSAMHEAQALLPERRRAFAITYEDIVLEAVR